MSDVAQVLRKARDLYAANPSHADLDFNPDPGTYCVYTAIERAAGSDNSIEYRDAADAICHIVGDFLLARWNAENSTETVLAAFDKAITEADNA
jgi:hypothetical protein